MRTLLFIFGALLFLCSCGTDSPIPDGTEVTVRNTFQSTADSLGISTDGQEISIEMVRGLEEGVLGDTTTIGGGIEFSNFIGRYDIDFGDSRIIFTNTADSSNPPFPGYFREVETGTFDRYYFTFDTPLDGNFAVSSNESVNAVFRSSTTLLVEIVEGFDTNLSGFVVTIE